MNDESCSDVGCPLVSVVIPVYNKERFLPDALLSFNEQTYKNIEWIIVDDGSTDASSDICRSWRARRGYIRLIKKENGGASSARNEGLRHARGEYVLFCDADDAQDPGAIEALVAAALSERADVVLSAIKRINQDGDERNLFVCDNHSASSEEALKEWLRGGRQRVRTQSWFGGNFLFATRSASRRV